MRRPLNKICVKKLQRNIYDDNNEIEYDETMNSTSESEQQKQRNGLDAKMEHDQP